MNRQKVHILVNSFWRSGMSGGDRRVIEIIRRWQDRGELWIYAPRAFHSVLEKEDIVHITPIVTDENVAEDADIIRAYFIRTQNAIKFLRQNCSVDDIIYSSSDILPDVLPAYRMKRTNRVKCWSMITYHINEKFYRRPGNIFANYLSCMAQLFAIKLGKEYADQYLTTNPLIYDDWKKDRKLDSKLFLVENAVDIKLVCQSDLETKHYDASFLARLNPSKGIYDLPPIWKKVTLKHPEARLAIMGKGDEATISALKKAFQEVGLEENVDIYGYVDSNQAYGVIRRSKCFLFPSHEEGWGMAVAEALLCRTPVVAYELPVFLRLFPNGGGILSEM